MWLTERTVLAVLGSGSPPGGYLDRRLGRRGVAGQQTDEARDPDRPANLWPVAGDWGAHGAFDDRALAHNPLVWASLHRWELTRGGLATIAGALAVCLLRR